MTRNVLLARNVLLSGLAAAVIGAASLATITTASAGHYGYREGYGPRHGYDYRPAPRYGFYGPRHHRGYGRPWWAHRAPPVTYGYGYGWR